MLASTGPDPKNDGTVKPIMVGLNAEAGMNSITFPSNGEMGPVADMSIFPPKMAPNTTEDNPAMSFESILSSDFWDSVLVPGMFILFKKLLSLLICSLPGYSNTLEGLSGGFVYGAGGNSVYIASQWGSPDISTANSPLTSIRPELTNSLT